MVTYGEGWISRTCKKHGKVTEHNNGLRGKKAAKKTVEKSSFLFLQLVITCLIKIVSPSSILIASPPPYFPPLMLSHFSLLLSIYIFSGRGVTHLFFWSNSWSHCRTVGADFFLFSASQEETIDGVWDGVIHSAVMSRLCIIACALCYDTSTEHSIMHIARYHFIFSCMSSDFLTNWMRWTGV